MITKERTAVLLYRNICCRGLFSGRLCWGRYWGLLLVLLEDEPLGRGKLHGETTVFIRLRLRGRFDSFKSVVLLDDNPERSGDT